MLHLIAFLNKGSDTAFPRSVHPLAISSNSFPKIAMPLIHADTFIMTANARLT